MAYAAVISLKHTINRLLNSNYVSYTDPSRKAMESAYQELESLQGVLKRLDDSSISSRSSERVAVLDGQIRDAAYKLEDRLESRISNLFLPRSESLRVENRLLSEWINSFAKMKKEYVKELGNPLPEKDDAAASSIRTDFGGNKSKMVGLSDEYNKLQDRLIRGRKLWNKVVSIVGMAGIGKTTLAKKIFEDPLIIENFECLAWVTVGPKYQSKEIVQIVLDQVTPDSYKMLEEEDKELYLSLTFKRYLIVLDDVWDCKVCNDLARFFRNQTQFLVTTRLEKVSKDACRALMQPNLTLQARIHQSHQIQMRLLDKEESWCLLREKVFGEDHLCSLELEKVGKKIAENCDGLPLTIVTIAEILSKAEKTVRQWEKAAGRRSSVFVEAYDQMTKVLISSYHDLPQYLKACFLYMGVFPQNYEIPISKLINLWSPEGFLETDRLETVGDFAMKCLKNLVSNNLLMIHQHSYDSRIKTCSLHSAFWQLCIRVARENKFLYVLNSYDDGLAESIEGHRRLCIHNNILFGIKDVYNSMASISAAHSLLCAGQHHQYPVPLCLGLRLLRVVDALTIRFYEFPMEVLNLVHLRYLALTYNGKLPASISKLWTLEFLIIRQHLSIKSPANSWNLPVEIWNMETLKHLQVMGNDLPDCNGCGSLQNLKRLLDVSARSCTKRVLGKFRSLKKLGIRIELARDTAKLMSCFDNLFELHSLESLKCVIVNPILMSKVVAAPPALLSTLPSCLKKLSLSGFGYGWENMSKIASLPNLEGLKLRCYAFRGPEWRTHKDKFSKLKYLLIEDTDLVHWRCDSWSCFPSLKRLIIRHCYKLKEIPQMSWHYELQMVEVVDSNPSAVTWAKQAREKLKDSIERYNLHDKFGDLDSIFKVKEMAPN